MAGDGMEWRYKGEERRDGLSPRYDWWLVNVEAPANLGEQDEDGYWWPPVMQMCWWPTEGCALVGYPWRDGLKQDMEEDNDDEDADHLFFEDVDELIAKLEAFKKAADWRPLQWDGVGPDWAYGMEQAESGWPDH